MATVSQTSSSGRSMTLLETRSMHKNDPPIPDRLQKIGYYRDKWRGRRWSMTKQLKMAETGAFRGPPPKAELLADVQILQTGAPWPNLGRVPRMANLPVAQRQQQRSRSPQGNRTNGEEAAPAGSNGKAGKKGGPKKGGKGGKGSEETANGPGEPLTSAAELGTQAEEMHTEVAGLEAEAEAVLSNSFERVAGAAMLAKLGTGGKVEDIMKEWDQNKDGALSNGEWRKSMRNSLALKASNEELDRVFSSCDGDKSGAVELGELKQLLKNMRAEAERASTESQRLKSRAVSLRGKAGKAREVQAATRTYEELAEKLRLMREGVPLASRLGEMLVRRQVKIGDLVATWDKDGSGELDPEEVRVNIVQLGVTVNPEHLPELREMFASLDLDGSGKLSLKEMQKMLKSLADSATGNTDGTKRLAKEVAAAKRTAKLAQDELKTLLGTAGLQSNKGDYGESDDVSVGAT